MLQNILSNLPHIYWTDVVDIIIVAFIIYKGIRLVKETRAEQLIKGIIILLILLQLSYTFRLNTINFLIRNTMQFGVIAVLIVFQPELRRALEKVGRSRVSNIFNFEDNSAQNTLLFAVNSISDACANLSSDRIGALIVIERDTKLGEIIRTGVELESKVSRQLLINIFIPNTPLHDGAVVVRKDRIMAAGCFLPLTANQNLNKELGTRHRAAIGMSENSDAVVVVVSEETGQISMALEGDLTRNLTPETLKKALMKLLDDNRKNPKAKAKKIFGRRGKKE